MRGCSLDVVSPCVCFRMAHVLHFDEQSRKVKDANMQDEDTFEIYDPRNPVNKRRREESKKLLKEKKAKRWSSPPAFSHAEHVLSEPHPSPRPRPSVTPLSHAPQSRQWKLESCRFNKGLCFFLKLYIMVFLKLGLCNISIIHNHTSNPILSQKPSEDEI